MVAKRVALLLTAGALAAGCYFPMGLLDDEGDFPMPTVLAVYSQGTAELTMNQAGAQSVVSFERVGPGSTLDSIAGASVTWRSDDGWVLRLTAYDASFPYPAPSGLAEPESYFSDVTLERIVGNELWRATSFGPAGNRCIVDASITGEALSGSATCRGLRWVDGFAAPYDPTAEGVAIEGQESFDAELTFEAQP